MALFRPRRRVEEETPSAPAEPTREHGPWDVDEQPFLDGRLDLGALRLTVPEGYGVQRPANDVDGQAPVVAIHGSEGMIRLRVFAAPKDGGVWGELRADVVREVTERGGQVEEVDGVFGPEVRCMLPVKGPNGEKLVQPSRVIGYDGRRWTLRATILGPAAKEPRDDGALIDVFRDAVVVRGAEARRSGETLMLTLPRAEDADD
ncbi:MAG: DUF3710 domain-containing protein [Aeromicrobium sp.]|uniref:DUF3710 domain-containing protein n=1 Tax=Aeromicrobium sp. TaxID=1871063 RepID=UPI0039E561B7